LAAIAVVIAVVSGLGVWLSAQSGPQPAFGELTLSPPNITYNTPTNITFTIKIGAPTLNPTTVQLQKVDAQGRVLAGLGRLYDDATHGDAVEGDKVFTAIVSLNEPTVGKSYFRVTAAFRGDRPNAASALTSLIVWNYVARADLPLSFAFPPSWTVSSPTAFALGQVFHLYEPEPATQADAGDITVFVWNNPSNLSYAEFFDGHPGPPLFSEVSGPIDDLVIDGRPSKLFHDVVGESTTDVLLVIDGLRFIQFDVRGGRETFDSLLPTITLR
jgi:hypothetical protein